MDRYKKATVVAMWVYFVVSTLNTYSEYQNIVQGKSWYLFTKIGLQVWLLGLCFWVRSKPLEIAPNLWVGIHVICSNIHGQFFSPWYVFSFAQMIIAFSFLFPLPRRHFNILLTIGTGAYLAAALYRYDLVYSWLYSSQRVDLVVATVSSSLIAFLSHNFFTVDRNHREELVRKFGIVGMQTANVVHDVKNMLAAPRMNLDILRKKMESLPDSAELVSLAISAEKQLISISDAMTGLHHVTALHTSKKQVFFAGDIVREVSETLNLARRRVHLEVVGDCSLYGERALFSSVVFNVLMNSVQVFRKRQITEPSIRIVCQERTIVIEDNAGGFSDEILSPIQKTEFSNFGGRGMGIFLVRNGVQSFGGRAEFSNTTRGARVSFEFPIAAVAKAKPGLSFLFRTS